MKIDVERKWTARIELDDEEAELLKGICDAVRCMDSDDEDVDARDHTPLSDFDLTNKHQELATQIFRTLKDQLLEGRG
jgi:hypothetical protein